MTDSIELKSLEYVQFGVLADLRVRRTTDDLAKACYLTDHVQIVYCFS